MGLTVRDLIIISRFCAIDRREYPLLYQGRKIKGAELTDILMPHIDDEVVRINFVLDCTALEIEFAEVEPESEAQQEKDERDIWIDSKADVPELWKNLRDIWMKGRRLGYEL